MAGLGGIGGRLYRGEVSVNFVGRQRLWYTISAVILAVSVIALLVFGLNFSVDFKGGSVFQFPAGTASITQVRQTVSGAGGGDDAIVQKITNIKTGNSDWSVQTHQLTSAQQSSVESAITHDFHLAPSQVSSQFVGASWGSQISKKALEALIALAHDIVITVGVYALLGFQVSPASVIGLLTILGYSLYDTVVVFDKVRENTAGLLGSARATYSQAANQALNQTLVRSINTSIIALLPVAAILFIGAGLLGAGELKDLALVLFVGMLSGTYSSICIATPVLADLKEREPQYKALAKRVAQRAASGRATKREAAKAGARSGPPGLAPGSALDDGGPDEEPGLDGPAAAPAGDEPADAGAASEPPTAGRPSPRGASPGGLRPGPRLLPRRTSAARRRPSGKKKRR